MPKLGRAKAITWNWDTIQSVYSDTAHCYRLTDRQIAVIMPVLQQAAWTTRWFGRPDDFGEIINFVGRLSETLGKPVECKKANTVSPDTVLSSASDCSEKEFEGIMIQIQNINGVDYLVEACCGGTTRFFQLTEVAIGGDGSPVSAQDGGANSFGNGEWDGIVDEGNITCYGDGATAYILERVIEFGHALVDWSFLGADVFGGNFDEILNVVTLVGDLLFGTTTLSEIQALTKSEITTALQSTAVVNALSAAWVYDTSVSRGDLREWANSAPYLNGTTPVRLIVQAWVDYSLMIGLNRNLEDIAAQCQSGNAFADYRNYDFMVSEQGWEPGLDAGMNDQATWDDGVGWTVGLATAQQHLVDIDLLNTPLAFRYARVTLSPGGMNGNRDELAVGVEGGDAVVVTATAQDVVVVDMLVNQSVTTKLSVQALEYTVGGGIAGVAIERVELSTGSF